MPIYLCKPGYHSSEPWKHVIQVYSSPFPKKEEEEEESENAILVLDGEEGDVVRRVRHAEIVLVDAIFTKYNRFWLRLVFPGASNQYAGCIPVLDVKNKPVEENSTSATWPNRTTTTTTEDESSSLFICHETGLSFLTTSQVLELLPFYDDGLGLRWNKPVTNNSSTKLTTTNNNNASRNEDDVLLAADGTETDVEDAAGETPILYGVEPVFCRICREGLHDVEWEAPVPQDTITATAGTTNNNTTNNMRVDVEKLNRITSTHPSVENPFISPCACSGSMAFVHYLCVEQWRIRSKHPDASGGTHCETCKTPYSLPPPPLNSNNNELLEDNLNVNNADAAWLDAMPPHVLVALREPHLWWQLGVAIVRRPFLRPLFPIISSPIVSMYCRARRSLKKRGVSRRRWSCSLCRRRARWKCVRCLRSYYCSRQCQNVSWHILHKHVCYKSSRFWCSFIFYTFLLLGVFPGFRNWPLLYLSGVFVCGTSSFALAGILGGSLAALSKRIFKIDIRGRYLEFVVVIGSLQLAWLMWRLQWAFFGYPQYCGANVLISMQSSFFQKTDLLMKSILWNPIGRMLTIFNLSLARKIQGKMMYTSILCGSPTMKNYYYTGSDTKRVEYESDLHVVSTVADTSWRRWARQNLLVTEQHQDSNSILKQGVVRGLVRDSAAPVCLMQLENINPNFLSDDPKCAVDMHLLLSILLLSGWITIWNIIQRRRMERRVAAAAARFAIANRALDANNPPIRMQRRRLLDDAVVAGHLHQE